MSFSSITTEQYEGVPDASQCVEMHSDTGEMLGSVTLRGRSFLPDEIGIIRGIISAHWHRGRTYISEEVCKALNWRQPNGWLKDRACRDVLCSLNRMGVIELPPSKARSSSPQYSKWSSDHASTDEFVTATPITTLSGPLRLMLAKGNQYEKQWNEIVQAYHYLGHKVTVGKCLKFLVYSGDILVSAVSLSEGSWSVKPRDMALDLLGIDRSLVANNSRFLILPHIQVRNLASRILSLLARDGIQEWQRYYSINLQCLETFVDSERFLGTSYKAANWIVVGTTKGYRKAGACHFNSQTPKHIFLYPLSRSARQALASSIANTNEDKEC